MSDTGIIGLILIIANITFSYKGFTNETFFNGYKFEVDKILINKDYKRLVTSGFLHVSWTHLIFNMISLYAFSGTIETNLGRLKFLIIYFVSLIGGDLFSLLVHRDHGDYNSVGASGAVCGIIFASIVLSRRFFRCVILKLCTHICETPPLKSLIMKSTFSCVSLEVRKLKRFTASGFHDRGF